MVTEYPDFTSVSIIVFFSVGMFMEIDKDKCYRSWGNVSIQRCFVPVIMDDLLYEWPRVDHLAATSCAEATCFHSRSKCNVWRLCMICRDSDSYKMCEYSRGTGW